MISLAMDTAGTVCAACLYDSTTDRILAEVSEEIGRGHAERLMGIISDVLDKAKVSYNEIGKIVTTVGPGSFTGIRVGVATARGFGVGLGIPVVGVTSLEAIMEDARETGSVGAAQPIIAVMEAGRGQVYAQSGFDLALARANTPFMSPLDQLASALDEHKTGAMPLVLCGSKATELAALLTRECAVIETPSAPRISVIAHIGADRPEAHARPEPLYLRKPDAKPQQGFAVERETKR